VNEGHAVKNDQLLPRVIFKRLMSTEVTPKGEVPNRPEEGMAEKEEIVG